MTICTHVCLRLHCDFGLAIIATPAVIITNLQTKNQDTDAAPLVKIAHNLNAAANYSKFVGGRWVGLTHRHFRTRRATHEYPRNRPRSEAGTGERRDPKPTKINKQTRAQMFAKSRPTVAAQACRLSVDASSLAAAENYTRAFRVCVFFVCVAGRTLRCSVSAKAAPDVELSLNAHDSICSCVCLCGNSSSHACVSAASEGLRTHTHTHMCRRKCACATSKHYHFAPRGRRGVYVVYVWHTDMSVLFGEHCQHIAILDVLIDRCTSLQGLVRCADVICWTALGLADRHTAVHTPSKAHIWVVCVLHLILVLTCG